MIKKEVQQRVLQNGKPLALSKFSWDKVTRTFSSTEHGLVIDFTGVDDCTFKTVYGCTFKTGWDCTFKTGSGCTFKTGSHCTFGTGGGCTFKTGSECTFETGDGCTFKTGSECTFETGWGCTFDTGWDCTFGTGWGCTFKTGSRCTFETGSESAIVRRDEFEVIQPNAGDVIQLCPSGTKGHLVNGLYNGEPHIIADGILSKIVKKKGDVYKVINHGEEKEKYLIERGGVFSHGDTISEAWDGLVYKLTEQDLSKYEGLTLASEVTHEDAIKMYRSITGACPAGTRYFIENNADKVKKSYTIEELLEAVEGKYGSEKFNQFFKGEK